MVEFWYKLVKNGVKTIDDVPTKYREAVRQKLAGDDR